MRTSASGQTGAIRRGVGPTGDSGMMRRHDIVGPPWTNKLRAPAASTGR